MPEPRSHFSSRDAPVQEELCDIWCRASMRMMTWAREQTAGLSHPAALTLELSHGLGQKQTLALRADCPIQHPPESRSHDDAR